MQSIYIDRRWLCRGRNYCDWTHPDEGFGTSGGQEQSFLEADNADRSVDSRRSRADMHNTSKQRLWLATPLPGAAVSQGQPLKPLSARRTARMELKGGARMELEVTGKMEQERAKRRMERYMALSDRKLKREKGGNRHGNITSVCGRGRRED